MSHRRILFLFLVGIGVGSPWLVRDWLEVRSGERRSRTASREARVATADREFPAFAQRTRRLFEGLFVGDSSGAGLGSLLSGRDEPAATPRSMAIVEEATARLAPSLAAAGLRAGDPVVLRLFKEERELEIWMKPAQESLYVLFKIHRLSAVAGGPGPKLREGDGQAPEGFYAVSRRGLRPETRHHLGLDFGFPNDLDQAKGRGGSEVWIHGGGSAAAGGYALAPAAMDEVYALVDAALRKGTASVPTHLFPFRLTDRRMDEVVKERSRWTDHWVQLKEGFDFFDNVRLPPAIDLAEGRPRFEIARRD
jgi:murein L,D-transpeptidase YafK